MQLTKNRITVRVVIYAGGYITTRFMVKIRVGIKHADADALQH